MIRFICGCTSLCETPIPFDGSLETAVVIKAQQMAYLSTFDSVTFDSEGFLVCGIHRQRRYGWRSVPYTATTMPVAGAGGWTELQYERYILFGEIPREEKVA